MCNIVATQVINVIAKCHNKKAETSEEFQLFPPQTESFTQLDLFNKMHNKDGLN